MIGARRAVVVSHTGLRSGAETVLLREIDWLAAAGWSIELLTPDGPLGAEARSRNVATRPIPDLKLPALPRPVAAGVTGARGVAAGWRLRRRAAGADIVILNGLLGLPALWVARRLGLRTPALWNVHDVITRRDWLALLGRVGGAADVALAVSRAAGAPVAGRGFATEVVPNGTTWPVAERPDRPGPPFVVGCAAMLTSWKGQDVLLDAFARLDRDDVHLELAGGSFPKDQPYADGLRARAARPDLAGRVSFLGHVDDPLATMRRWDLGVNASVDPEAAPLVLLEYMSIGLPYVATDHGGTSELLARGECGVGVPPGDADALAAAIDGLLDDTGRRSSLGTTGRAMVEQDYTLERQRDRFLDTVEETIRRGTARRPH